MAKRRSSQVKISLFSFQDIITSVTGIMILTTLLLALELLNRSQGSPPVQTEEHTVTTQKTSDELRAEIEMLHQQLNANDQDVRDLPSLSDSTLKQMVDAAKEDSKRLQEELNTIQTKLNERLQEAKQVQSDTQSYKQNGAQQLQDLQTRIAEMEQRINDIEGSNRVFYSSGIKDKKMWIVEITASGMAVAEMGVRSVPRQFASVVELKRWISTLKLSDNALFLLIKPGGALTFRQVESYLSGKMDFGFQVVATNQQVLDPKIGAGKP